MNKTLSIIVIILLAIIALSLLLGKVQVYTTLGNKTIAFTNKGGLRETCLKCVRKHISQAIVLLNEAQLGYPEHFWLAMGHLAEAESESIKLQPELAAQIREAREKLIAGENNINLMSFYSQIDKIS